MSTAMEAYGKLKIAKKNPIKVEKIISVWTKKFTSDLKDNNLSDHRDVEDASERGEAFLRKLWSTGIIDTFDPIAVEEEINATYAGVPIVGYIDMVEPTCVTDFKVASQARYYDPAKSLQLQLYACEKNQPNVAFLIYEKRTGSIIPKDHTFQDLDAVRRWVTRVVGTVAYAISAGAFPVCNPKENNLCSEKWCPYWAECAGLAQ